MSVLSSTVENLVRLVHPIDDQKYITMIKTICLGSKYLSTYIGALNTVWPFFLGQKKVK